MFICLNAQFMSHEQCKMRWSKKKKKKKKRQNIKRGCGREIQMGTKCNYLIKGRKGL